MYLEFCAGALKERPRFFLFSTLIFSALGGLEVVKAVDIEMF